MNVSSIAPLETTALAGPRQAVPPSPLRGPEVLERELAQATYFSPVVRLDVDTQQSVLQFRDSGTGEIVAQFPSEKQLKAYRDGAAPGRAAPEPPPRPPEATPADAGFAPQAGPAPSALAPAAPAPEPTTQPRSAGETVRLAVEA